MPVKERRPPRPRRPRSPKKRAAEALALLEAQQGRAEWSPRYDPVTELVFTILSQHTSDVNSERAGHRLKSAYSSWDEIADAPPEEITPYVLSAGLAKQKVPRIQETLKQVRELTGGYDLSFLAEMPLDQAKAWLRALPGVGPKTTAIVLCFALGMPAMAVDTHVHRVSKRLGLIGPKVSAESAHDVLESLVPPEEVYAFHVALIAHGRQVCKALRPLCPQCVLRDGCPERRDEAP